MTRTELDEQLLHMLSRTSYFFTTYQIQQTFDNANGCVCFCNRFQQGLTVLNVLDAIQQHPQVMRALFCHEAVKLTATALDNLFQPQLSDSGSNRRTTENVIYAWWLDYLQEVEGCNCYCFLILTHQRE